MLTFNIPLRFKHNYLLNYNNTCKRKSIEVKKKLGKIKLSNKYKNQ